ncbi:MAG: DUF2142 domain-containing protein [Ilumatobacteraceae bacterium]
MRAPKISKSFARFIAIRALMALLLFMTLAAWSMGSAVGSSPDEDYVLTSIWCGTEGNPPYCRKDPDRYWGMILPIMAAEPQLCYVRTGQDISAKCQEGIYNQEISTELLNRGLNPKRYFDVQRSFVGADVEASVVKMRLLNSFLAAVLIISASAFFWKKNSELLLAWLAVIAPVTSYFIASVNTSSWNLIGVTIFAITFFSALRNREDPMLSIPAGAAALFAVWFTNSSRYEGKYVILLLAAAILYSEFAPKNLKFTKKTALISLAILPLIYLIYNYFADVYGRVNIFDDPRFEVTEGITTTANNLLLQNFVNLPRFIMGFFGGWGLGWFELELTHTVWLFTSQAFLLTTVFALRKSSNAHRLIFGALFTMMCIAILYANQQTFSKVGNVIQPRYFLPFFLRIVIIAAANKTERYPNSLVITVAILATISNSIALRDTIRRYTTGQDVFISKSLNNPIEWWWQFGPQPETVWLTGTLAFAALWAILIYDRNKEELNAPNSPTPELAS